MKRTLTLMGLTSLNTIAVFLYQWWIVTRLGPAEGTDALFASMVVPQLVLNVISSSLTYVLVPLLSNSDERDSRVAVWTLSTGLGVLFGGVAALLALFAPLWIPLTVPGFSAAMRSQTARLVDIQLIGMALSGICAPMGAAYQARERFAYPLLVTLFASIISFAFLVATLPSLGIVGAAWGLVLRPLIQFILLFPIAFPFVAPDFRSSDLCTSLKNLLPLITGSLYYKTDQLVDRLLASLAPAGALSILHLAQQINGALAQVLVNAIAGPAIPSLSVLARDGNHEAFKQKCRDITRKLMITGALVYLGTITLGRPLLEYVFEGRKFSPLEVNELWIIMIASGLYWLSGLWGQILSNIFYTIQDTQTPTRIGMIGFTAGIPLKIAGFVLFGVPGIMVGAGIFALGNALAMHIIIDSRLRAGSILSHLTPTRRASNKK